MYYSLTLRIKLLIIASLAVAGCSTTTPRSADTTTRFAANVSAGELTARQSNGILTIGDSMMTWNTVTGQSIPQQLAYELGEKVVSRAVPGAKIFLNRLTLVGMSIPGQFKNERWDTVVLNGGGNDIWQNCGCGKCDDTLDMLISADGKRGKIPSLVKYGLLPVADRAIYVGYLRTPGTLSLVEGCADEAAELDRRLERLDAATPRFRFVSSADIVPEGSSRYHSLDTVHPSALGSKAIAQRVAVAIKQMRR